MTLSIHMDLVLLSTLLHEPSINSDLGLSILSGYEVGVTSIDESCVESLALKVT